MSNVMKPTLVPWASLHAQLSADYGRLRDLNRMFLSHPAMENCFLEIVVHCRTGRKEVALPKGKADGRSDR